MKDLVKRISNGLTYQDYHIAFQKLISETKEDYLDGEGLSKFQYTKLNLHRTNRVHKTYKPSDSLEEAISAISQNQIWMVLTEFWCGDSAQNLPYIGEISKLNPHINLRILHRDENLDIMDKYLTNGTARSIPKLVSFDENGDEIFQWGPRPEEGQRMVDQWKAEGLEKDEFIEKLHFWYAKNRGKSIEQEFIALLNSHCSVLM